MDGACVGVVRYIIKIKNVETTTCLNSKVCTL